MSNLQVNTNDIPVIRLTSNTVVNAGSGTCNYNDLTNKPQINSVTLSGNKSLDDLSIQHKLTAGSNITIENNVISATGGGGSEPAAYIKNASVEGNVLTLTKKDNTTVVYEPEFDIPTKTSDLENDSNFITSSYHDSTKQDVIDSTHKLATNLINTDDSNQFVSSTEKATWNNKQSAITVSNKLDASLIETSASNRFVSDTEKGTWNNKLGSILYDSTAISNADVHNVLEANASNPTSQLNTLKVGNTVYQLRNGDVATVYSNYQTMIAALNAETAPGAVLGHNYLIVALEVPDLWVSEVHVEKTTYTYVDDATVIAALNSAQGLVCGYYTLRALETTKVDLTGYIRNTDYASASTGGVIKTGNDVSLSNGVIQADTETAINYAAANNTIFLSKGTLENLKTAITYTDEDGNTGTFYVL